VVASCAIGNWKERNGSNDMAWTRPILREICIGMEINGYFGAQL
jgi:coenzyme PQQ precursor peptide PqqA